MDNSSSQGDDLMKLLVAASIAILSVSAVLYFIDDMTIKSLKPTIIDEDTATYRQKIESPNANYLVSTKDEWKHELHLYLNDYLEKRTDGLLYIEDITISSGSINIDETVKSVNNAFIMIQNGNKAINMTIETISKILEEEIPQKILAFFNKGKTPQKA